MADTKTNADVVIVGGGLVGMALALALAKGQLSSILIESNEVSPDESSEDSFDDRTLVINPASQQFWQLLGIWSIIEPLTTAIHTVHVSNQGKFGVVHFDKDELQVPQLGHVIAAKTLANMLVKQVIVNDLIDYQQPASLVEFEQHEGYTKLCVESRGISKQYTAQLMVAADGVQSSIRSKLNLMTEIKSYERTAVICNVTTSQPHQYRAFERLTAEGPMALLPFKNRFGFVWSMNTTQAQELLAADDQQFMAAAQQQFGYRAGSFEQLGRRSSYPLYQVKVPLQYAHRVVLMGNAAHAVSPVSAQGLNLAVRGIKRLSHLLQAKHQQGLDLGSAEVLRAYQESSEEDQQRTLNYTDDLMTWFKIDEPVVNGMRSLALVAINASLGLKQALFNTAGGLK